MLIDNPSANSNKLILENINIDHSGMYKCQITCKNQVFFSQNQCELFVINSSECKLLLYFCFSIKFLVIDVFNNVLNNR
jgi:hypothetical protein